jgi:hypothetical protein
MSSWCSEDIEIWHLHGKAWLTHELENLVVEVNHWLLHNLDRGANRGSYVVFLQLLRRILLNISNNSWIDLLKIDFNFLLLLLFNSRKLINLCSSSLRSVYLLDWSFSLLLPFLLLLGILGSLFLLSILGLDRL